MDTKQNKSRELSNYMADFYGTEHYFSGKPFLNFLFTDGVQAFCNKAEAYWFLIEAQIAINAVKQDFLAIHLEVHEDESCDVYVIGDDARKHLYSKHIPYTDCPAGDWIFFYERQSNVFYWYMEH